MEKGGYGDAYLNGTVPTANTAFCKSGKKGPLALIDRCWGRGGGDAGYSLEAGGKEKGSFPLCRSIGKLKKKGGAALSSMGEKRRGAPEHVPDSMGGGLRRGTLGGVGDWAYQKKKTHYSCSGGRGVGDGKETYFREE